ncbi:MAG TPA: hypothetical protein VK421_10730 [Pyrinomonadaceae bacterium]|nr:hypothetical protein [Pyrinomonadaceae bacterium]
MRHGSATQKLNGRGTRSGTEAPIKCRALLRLCLRVVLSLGLLPQLAHAQTTADPREVAPAGATVRQTPNRTYEYLWFEAENMRGFATDKRNEPIPNPSWLNQPREKTPGWGMNGPGVSAEWTQGGESEWNSAAASADETRAALHHDLEVPRAGRYRVWVRYADWAGRDEAFTVRLAQQGKEVARHEFGARDRLDRQDEVSAYWGWAFTWDATPEVSLAKGAARVSVEIERASAARRHVDCLLVTDDPNFVPEGRRKPEFAGWRVLREWSARRTPVTPLITADAAGEVPRLWQRPKVAGREFLMPWNVSAKFWELYETPAAGRPLYPFHVEEHLVEPFVEKYRGAKDVPLFSSKLVAPVIYINDVPRLLKEGSPFVNYLRETRAPFAILINYGTAEMPEGEAQAAWKLLTGELREQFLGWVSGESIGYVYPQVAAGLTLTPAMPRRQMLEAYRDAYTRELDKKWSAIFRTPTGPMWDKLIAAQSTSTTAYAHALGAWGSRLIGIETAAVQPNTAMRMAFARGAARQTNGAFLYYHAPNFGDTATTFTRTMNFAGPDHFFHTRYGPTMGPSLSWYRKSYYLYYMGGASAVYLEQGYDQFFKPGPGEHPLQLNPLGRITEEFMRFAERHPERGVPYTPVAFLLDPAHGWDMTDWPHWPFGVAQIERHDHALRELFGAAYYPANAVEGEPATADRQAFVNSAFGDIFDVLVASERHAAALDSYRALVVGGRVEWPRGFAERLRTYVRAGGTLVLNAAQAKGLPEDLLGVRLTGATAEADDARCLSPGESSANLQGSVFSYERIEPRTAKALVETPTGDALVTVNRVGRGQVVFVAVPDLLGLDERIAAPAAHALVHLLAEATPVSVEGDVQHLVNRTPTGWVVTIFNNDGVDKPQQGMARVDRRAVRPAALGLRGKEIASAREWTNETALAVTKDAQGRPSVRLEVPPGGVRVVELVERR